MVYLLLQNRIYTSKEQIYKDDLKTFLFWSQFLIRKRIIENIE